MKSRTAIIILMAISIFCCLLMFYLLKVSNPVKDISEIKNSDYSNSIKIKKNNPNNPSPEEIEAAKIETMRILNEEKKNNPNNPSPEEIEAAKIETMRILNEEKKNNPNNPSPEEIEAAKIETMRILNEEKINN